MILVEEGEYMAAGNIQKEPDRKRDENVQKEPHNERAELFSNGGLLLAWALYIAYFCLPVTGPAAWGSPDSYYLGVQTFLASFVFPFLWPAAVGHVLFWVGSVLLAKGWWRGATVAGLLALAASIVPAVMVPAYIGMYCNVLASAVLAMTALALTALIGSRTNDTSGVTSQVGDCPPVERTAGQVSSEVFT
jgi:hypothetical protein